jgi:hypothetical protein
MPLSCHAGGGLCKFLMDTLPGEHSASLRHEKSAPRCAVHTVLDQLAWLFQVSEDFTLWWWLVVEVWVPVCPGCKTSSHQHLAGLDMFVDLSIYLQK